MAWVKVDLSLPNVPHPAGPCELLKLYFFTEELDKNMQKTKVLRSFYRFISYSKCSASGNLRFLPHTFQKTIFRSNSLSKELLPKPKLKETTVNTIPL